ncbi:tumor protein p53-inducible nuclear protein 1 isoform X1 [Conger conger]|uniref:tumor protein p53-inducible nuclear protein 1 isoform X1 n=1 Tax=Conger conger TaxID=82655 RepID=UPI002A5A2D97|nr:tumor protein p53-inducible nuclear protein 1 isoform X1 [Conger conger]XP_061072512.1 tumor protein p53-inducible nuclear protein 1 isoform X1 [Conger conger]XP_061072520.1 tumor protein p53-inducible nuclear protein 1 isoform X1 [Conger conger]
MFQRLTSILFGDEAEDGSECPVDPAFNEKEDEEDWILVDYLAADPCVSPCLELPAGLCPQDLPGPDCPVRYSSCSSLDSAADDAEDGGFLRLEACALEESWFITPPPCFTAGGRGPVLLETSPLENLLIEHPSMSVYAVHAPRRALREGACRSLEQPLLRVEAPRRPSTHAACYSTALSARSFPEPPKQGRLAQRPRDGPERQHLSRNALRRLNLLRDGTARQAKSGNGVQVHQPGQRQFNY